MAAQISYNQLTFAQELSAKTGLNLKVIEAWLLQEQGTESANPSYDGLYNFLNIGITGSARAGATDSIWNNPRTAADATAAWLKGSSTAVPGYGHSSSGVQSIATTAGQSPSAQIAAIQASGWASSGEPSLPSLYQEVAGGLTPTGSAAFAPGPSVASQAKTAAQNVVNSIPNAITGVWNSFTSWIPKFALEMLLIISGLGLLVLALGRTVRSSQASGASA